MVGFKYKMSNIQAAIGFAQLERVGELIDRKRQIFRGYCERLAGLNGVRLNAESPGTIIGAWMPSVVFDPATGVTREKLQSAFAAENIDARVFFHPLSSLPMFEEQREHRHACEIPGRAINLPSYHDITPCDQDRVVAVVGECLSA
jgi:perosamine synthetase